MQARALCEKMTLTHWLVSTAAPRRPDRQQVFVYNFRFRRFRGDSLISGHLSKHWACYSLYRAASRAPDSAFTKTAWARLWHCAVEKPKALGVSNASFFTDRNVHKHFCNLECWFLAEEHIEHILDFLIICFPTEFMEHFCEFLSMIYFFTTMFSFIAILQYYNSRPTFMV